MNCEYVSDKLPAIIAGGLSTTELADCKQHLVQCADCADALRGTEALVMLRDRETGQAPGELFGRIVTDLDVGARQQTARGFWLGTGFGGVVAASLLALALALGWLSPPPAETGPAAAAEFVVSLGERRQMDVAIETEQALAGATISVMLSGGIELDGYGNRRELSWTTDLEAGINRLSLPVRATDADGGRMVVRLSHPDSEQVFVVQLRTQV